MKRILIVTLILVVALVVVSMTYAQAPDPGQATMFGAVQNVGTEPATFKQDFYSRGETLVLVASREQANVAVGDSMGLTPHDNVTGAPLNFELPPGWIGSSVVSSSQPSAAVVLTQWVHSQIGDGVTSADYVGEGGPGSDIFCPSVGKRNNEESTLVVMNASDSTIDDVSISFKDRDGNEVGIPMTDISIPAYSQKEFNLFAPVFDLPYYFLGAARVQSASGKPLAVVAITHWGSAEGAYGTFSYNCATTGASATRIYAPKVQRRILFGGWFDASGVVVVNTEGADATVKVSYYDRAGNDSGTFTDTVPAYSARGYNTRYYGNADESVIDAMIGIGTVDEPNWQGSAVVESLTGQKIVGLVKQGYDTQLWAGGYNMLSDVDAARNWSFPLVYRRGFNGPWTDYVGIICQNVSDVSIAPTIAFVDRRPVDKCTAAQPCKFTDEEPYTQYITHGFNTRYGGAVAGAWFADEMEDNFLGAATATITGEGKMVCIQETWAEEVYSDGVWIMGGDANLNNAYGW
jgi:hypothetical protein